MAAPGWEGSSVRVASRAASAGRGTRTPAANAAIRRRACGPLNRSGCKGVVFGVRSSAFIVRGRECSKPALKAERYLDPFNWQYFALRNQALEGTPALAVCPFPASGRPIRTPLGTPNRRGSGLQFLTGCTIPSREAHRSLTVAPLIADQRCYGEATVSLRCGDGGATEVGRQPCFRLPAGGRFSQLEQARPWWRVPKEDSSPLHGLKCPDPRLSLRDQRLITPRRARLQFKPPHCLFSAHLLASETVWHTIRGEAHMAWGISFRTEASTVSCGRPRGCKSRKRRQVGGGFSGRKYGHENTYTRKSMDG